MSTSDTKERTVRKVVFNDYIDMLRNHKWPWECDNFSDLSESIRQEHRFTRIAFESNSDFMRAYVYAIRDKISDKVREAVREEHDRMLARLEVEAATGDAEFDAYRKDVLNHDYYYHYSDDGGVYRRGSEHAAKIKKIADEKGGIYLAFYKHYYDSMLAAHNARALKNEEDRRKS